MLHGQGADAAGLERLKAVARIVSVPAPMSRGARAIWQMPARHLNSLTPRAPRSAALMRSSMPPALPIDAISSQLPRAGLERAFAVMAAAFHELAATAYAGSDARSARTRRRHQQFRRASIYA